MWRKQKTMDGFWQFFVGFFCVSNEVLLEKLEKSDIVFNWRRNLRTSASATCSSLRESYPCRRPGRSGGVHTPCPCRPFPSPSEFSYRCAAGAWPVPWDNDRAAGCSMWVLALGSAEKKNGRFWDGSNTWARSRTSLAKKPLNQSINQTKQHESNTAPNQSINRSIDQNSTSLTQPPIKQSINRNKTSLTKPQINQSINQSIELSISSVRKRKP